MPALVAAPATAHATGLELLTERSIEDRLGMTHLVVVGIYVATAAGVGLIVLIARAWATTRIRSMFVGLLSGGLFAFLFNLLIAGPVLDMQLRGLQVVVFVLFIAFVPGAILGAIAWDPSDRDARQ